MGPKSLLSPASKYSRMPVSISTADESYCRDKRKAKRGRGAAGKVKVKVKVFIILKRGGKVYMKVIAEF
tara:strand:+ start:222 stop:428 length:207 start_codon:yes stop_codon:yes gene_type:complete